MNMGTSIRAPGTTKARQTSKPSDVSDEGQSLRSSLSAGKPRTRRREAAGRYSMQAAGVSHVYGI
jgi:hypothetical protein